MIIKHGKVEGGNNRERSNPIRGKNPKKHLTGSLDHVSTIRYSNDAIQ